MTQPFETKNRLAVETWGGIRMVGGEERDWLNEVEEVKVDEVMGIALWRHIDLRDFSTARFFVTKLSDPGFVFEVDFLSRHELIYPMTRASLPMGWEEWAAVTHGSIFVFDKEAFTKRMLTADAYVALPLYRFQNLVSDVESATNGNKSQAISAIFKILSRRFTGYSFKLYMSDNANYEEMLELCLAHSCLEGKIYENRRLFRLALEQLQFRQD